MGQNANTVVDTMARAQISHPPDDNMSAPAGRLQAYRRGLGSYVKGRLWKGELRFQWILINYLRFPSMPIAYNAVRHTTSETCTRRRNLVWLLIGHTFHEERHLAARLNDRNLNFVSLYIIIDLS